MNVLTYFSLDKANGLSTHSKLPWHVIWLPTGMEAISEKEGDSCKNWIWT